MFYASIVEKSAITNIGFVAIENILVIIGIQDNGIGFKRFLLPIG